MYKRILVAVDGSDVSNRALKEAIKLAKEQKARLKILHVLDQSIVDYTGMGIDFAAYAASVRKYGQDILKKAEQAAHRSRVTSEGELVETMRGRIEEKIIEEAKKWPAELLVIGTHGRRGFSHLLLGSVAEGVVRMASVPVLLIRGEKPKA